MVIAVYLFNTKAMKNILFLVVLLFLFKYNAFSQCSDPDAGSGFAVCGPSCELHVTDATTGYWTACYGLSPINPQPIFSPSNTSQTPVVTLQELMGNKIIKFVWTDNSGPCTDTVQVEFVEIPVVFAGEDKDVCGPYVVMEGVSSGFTGSWLPNGSDFDDFSDPQASVFSGNYAEKTFTWLEIHQAMTASIGCSSQDDVVITFWRKPTANILTEATDSITCGLTFCNLRAENPGAGITGNWLSDDPVVAYEQNPDNTDTRVTFSTYGIHNLYWVESVEPELYPGFCSDTAGPLRLHFVEQPLVSAGADDYLYGYSYELNGEILIDDNPDFDMTIGTSWQTDNAVLDNSAGLTTNATVATFGEYEFTLLAYYTDFASCFYRDTVNITYVDPVFIGIEKENQEETKFNIFPNPVSSMLNIVSTVGPEQIQITDINGRLIKTLSGNCKSIDISALEAGVYFIKIFLPDGIQLRKFVKE